MPANDPPLELPTRGVAAGWRDWWDDPDDSAELRARAEATERRHEELAEQLGRTLQGELSRAAACGTVDAMAEGACFAG